MYHMLPMFHRRRVARAAGTHNEADHRRQTSTLASCVPVAGLRLLSNSENTNQAYAGTFHRHVQLTRKHTTTVAPDPAAWQGHTMTLRFNRIMNGNMSLGKQLA